MLDVYRVSFIGHREVDDSFFVEDQLYSVVKELILTKEYVEFYVGRNGEFDILVASVIRRVRRRMGEENSSLILVIPYAMADIEYYEDYYDEVRYPRELYSVHYKSAITKRNEWLVENSDMLVAYVVRNYGGAAHCLHKAIEYGIEIKRVDRASVEQD
ncbi:MAG: hypothetical protein K2M95_04665 [Clostridiales bacterium]|nr:hypothetical protein [Clostridiales bacterium]